MRYSMRFGFIITILICSILLTSCKETESIKIDNKAVSEINEETSIDTENNKESNNESNNVISPTNESPQENHKNMQVIGNGTITNPYECNNSFKVNLNCEIPDEGDSSSITLEVSSLFFYKESDSDGWFTSFSLKLIDHKGDFPINLSDYIKIVFYDDNNKSIGNTEHLLLDQDSDEADDLVFNEKRMKGSVSNFEKSEVFNQKNLSKVSIKYYSNGQYKEIFFKQFLVPGTFLNPHSSTDLSIIYDATIPNDDYISAGFKINGVTFSKTTSGYTLKVDLKFLSVLIAEGGRSDGTINTNDYLSIVYYSKDEVIGKLDHTLYDADGNMGKILNREETCSLYSNTTKKDFNNKIPTIVGIKYYDGKKYKEIFYDIQQFH